MFDILIFELILNNNKSCEFLFILSVLMILVKESNESFINTSVKSKLYQKEHFTQ